MDRIVSRTPYTIITTPSATSNAPPSTGEKTRPVTR